MSKFACEAPAVWVLALEDNRDGYACAEHLHAAAAALAGNDVRLVGVRPRTLDDGTVVQPCGWSSDVRQPVEYETVVALTMGAAKSLRDGDDSKAARVLLQNAALSVAHQAGGVILGHLASGQSVDVVVKLRPR